MDFILHDMVHNNLGMVPYESAYQSLEFLKERGYDGKVNNFLYRTKTVKL